MKKKIFITGGAGYVGSMLVPFLIKKNFKVTVLDLFIYGQTLKKNKNLKLIKGDIRDHNLLKKNIPGHDALIHLACISNDPSFELDPVLGKSINLESFQPLIEIAYNSKVKHFIYASSSSVYGIKSEKNVSEDLVLKPLTDYSLFKAKCEDILKEYSSKNFITTILRPATVCGFSTRQRFDLVVNILVNQAYHKREIDVLGGEQLRPNINILDMINAYHAVINSDHKKINNEIFNVGTENISVKNIAYLVKSIIGKDIKINFKNSFDNRSYHISSKKIKKVLGFKFKYTVEDAIFSLKKSFEKKIFINPLENSNYFNIKKMNELKIK
jgi:nucleoside-diphosphate-sugar epimerase